eukprot:CAMPEP_0115165662 /NCGR_PEP_ID=MMETSP0227-20121206/73713_1 /TAXON_ID=89957 /ORGANISM="Polarella glacialis, Strain CCMP 1383" /LENGTH=130 /DNA_ID=CAMNT_0002578151 /DNA_START=176 /DNA_END=569 /DNA_ORIENTATION=-
MPEKAITQSDTRSFCSESAPGKKTLRKEGAVGARNEQVNGAVIQHPKYPNHGGTQGVEGVEERGGDVQHVQRDAVQGNSYLAVIGLLAGSDPQEHRAHNGKQQAQAVRHGVQHLIQDLVANQLQLELLSP